MSYREEDIENEFKDLFLEFFEFLEEDDFSRLECIKESIRL